jgi:hypothetical protein
VCLAARFYAPDVADVQQLLPVDELEHNVFDRLLRLCVDACVQELEESYFGEGCALLQDEAGDLKSSAHRLGVAMA